ncbi:MAG: nuclear transport factor 2 family protein, partial [Candidatus Hodarchaeota archaeon]
MQKVEIEEFCYKWLSTWTGNKPEKLIAFYSENSYYQDPANPKGLRGHKHILPYFKKLLAVNPDWKWEA